MTTGFNMVPRRNWGRIIHEKHTYGISESKIPLDIYLPGTNKPEILLLAGIHGDESETVVLLSEALRRIESDDLKNAVILCANPDGTLLGTRANGNGVDLNRNFPAANWSPKPIFYRPYIGESQDIELSPGRKAESESETVGLIKIIDEIKPKAVISFHGSLACIDDPLESSLGKWIARKTGLPLVADVGYPTPGSFGSWAAENNLPIITFEYPAESLSRMKQTFIPVLTDLLTGVATPEMEID